jgi:hypothetical protein
MSDRFYSRFNLFKENNGKSYLNFSEFDLMSDDDDNSFISSFNKQEGVAFNKFYQQILDKATSLGFTKPSQRVQILQNDLVNSLVEYGIWGKLDVLYVFAQDGGEDFGTINWISPSSAISATLVNSPTFVINGGFQGNGTSSYIDTNFNTATQGVDYTRNNASMYFFPHAIGSSTTPFTGTISSDFNRTQRNASFNQRISSTNSLSASFDFDTTITAKSIHRTSSTNVTLYNGTASGTRTQTSSVLVSLNLLILRSFNSTAPQYGNHTCAAFSAGASLVAENTNFVNSWNTYKNSL